MQRTITQADLPDTLKKYISVALKVQNVGDYDMIWEIALGMDMARRAGQLQVRLEQVMNVYGKISESSPHHYDAQNKLKWLKKELKKELKEEACKQQKLAAWSSLWNEQQPRKQKGVVKALKQAPSKNSPGLNTRRN